MPDVIAQYDALFVGRRTDHCIQFHNGHYSRAGRPLDRARLLAHLRGEVSLATYLIDEQGRCRQAVMDADAEDGLRVLAEVQKRLRAASIPAWLERSRRGGHLWIFLERPVSAALVRSWLLPFCPPAVEFYPKQDSTYGGYGSAIRLPFGIHRRSNRRYPFIEIEENAEQASGRALGQHVSDQITCLFAAPRAVPPAVIITAKTPPPPSKRELVVGARRAGLYPSIRAWNAAQDPFLLIGRYVSLDQRGVGHCPFGEHHASGADHHASFQVYRPHTPGGSCWRCYTWNQGGSVFDFLKQYYQLEAWELWQRIQQGAF